MVAATVRKPKAPESRAERLKRALDRAHENGIQLLMEGESETWFATSGTMPGIIYRVDLNRCTCQGFSSFGMCQHHALFLDRHGLRPPTALELDAAIAERDEWDELVREGEVTSIDVWRRVYHCRNLVARWLDIVAKDDSETDPLPA